MPPPMTNLVLWLEADGATYKDTAGTLPATADGDLVALWKDQSGNGNDVLQATSGNRPTLKTAIINGKPVLRFSHAGAKFLATAASVAHGIGTGDFWLAGVWEQFSGANAFNSFFSVGSFAPAFYWSTRTGASPYQNTFYFGGGNSFGSFSVLDSTFYLTEDVRVAGTVKEYQSSGGASPVASPNTFAIGTSIANAILYVGNDNSGDYFDGDIAELVFYKASLNSTDQASLENYLRAKYWNTGPAAASLLEFPYPKYGRARHPRFS